LVFIPRFLSLLGEGGASLRGELNLGMNTNKPPETHQNTKNQSINQPITIKDQIQNIKNTTTNLS
jgi:hypothetical protein